MAIVTTDDKHYKDIADELRTAFELVYGQSGKNSSFKPEDMSTAVRMFVQDGISNSYDQGKNDGIAEGIEQGRQAAYDAFWDEFQNNGGETNYYYAFAYGRFTDANYNPKYDIVCSTGTTTSSQSIFYSASEITDTKVAIYANGRQANAMFYGCSALKTITKLVVHEDLTYTNAFGGCSALEDITIEGTIGKAIDFSPCKKLNRASIESIIGALSANTSGLEAKFSNHAAYVAFQGNLEDWNKVISQKENWTITLDGEI